MNDPKYWMSMLLLLAALKLAAQPAEGFVPLKEVAAFQQALEQASARIHTIDSDFVQEKQLSFLSNKVVSNGHFSFKKDNQLRWEYVSPYSYLIIINGDKISISDEQQQSAFDMKANKMFQEINRVMMGSVQGTIFKGEDFEASFYESEDQYLVQAVPRMKSMRDALQRIDIYFDKKDLTVAELKLLEQSGDYTRIVFTRKQVNIPIPDEQFRLD
ncbi:MAG: outer membrane lipoprotein carrier protein LolA [Bacteroidetes bacterium]|nr:MAG: outer membrane lipoprotein carrier protein LolA [Bacteroidota bacterium]